MYPFYEIIEVDIHTNEFTITKGHMDILDVSISPSWVVSSFLFEDILLCIYNVEVE